jgi:hypothetical protein
MNLTIQRAHHKHNEFDDLGPRSLEESLGEFDKFEWFEECSKVEEYQRVSPTLSLQTSDKSKLIWVSGVLTDHKELEFVSECHYPGVVSAWFGLSQKMGTVNHGAGDFTLEQAREALRLFFLEDYQSVKRLYEK